ncbi:branched-chain amino acid ABC transporter permease [Stappia indica]|nr:branched-chain amino acid ABC transporter permease [Stappia indica]MCA1300181.1 branched-chain amino acid ABC transporter permease [Stappia indica]
MDTFAFAVVNGLLYGMLLFMLASGLTLIFSLMGVLNFAHASFFMLGAYFAFQLSSVGNFWLGLVLAPLLVGLLGATVERYGLRVVHRHGHVAELLFTFGLAYLIEELVRLVWGRQPVPYRIPEALDFPLFSIGGIDYSAYRGFMFAIAVLVFLGLLALLKRTRVGLMVQAALSHPDVLWALGHNVPRLFMLVFGGGVALAGLAGVIGGNYLVTEPGMAHQMGTILFVIVVFGGLGSLLGAFLASILIGILQTLMVAFDGTLTDLVVGLGGAAPQATGPFHEIWTITPANLAPVLPYLLLVVLLIVRPRGLLGTRET